MVKPEYVLYFICFSFDPTFKSAAHNKYLRDKARWDMLSRTLGTGEDDMLHKAWGEYRVCLTGFYCSYFFYCLLDEGAGEDTKCLLQMEDLHHRGSHYLHVLEYHSSWVFHCGDFLLFWDSVLATG